MLQRLVGVIPVEHAKPAEEKSAFLFPEGFGRPSAADTFTRQAQWLSDGAPKAD